MQVRTSTTPVVRAHMLDGNEVLIRPITPDDGPGLVKFHGTLSAESTRTRFFVVHPRLSDNEVAHFTVVDHCRREALVAVVEGDIVGVGRYDRVQGTDRAEVAFVVADRWQGLGIATLLFECLAQKATTASIRHFRADTLADNRSMLRVFAHTGTVTRRGFDHGVVELEMDLAHYRIDPTLNR